MAPGDFDKLCICNRTITKNKYIYIYTYKQKTLTKTIDISKCNHKNDQVPYRTPTGGQEKRKNKIVKSEPKN